MRKVFYDPNTLEIKGFSDGENSLNFPYIETGIVLHETTNYKIKIVDGTPTLLIRKLSYSDEEWDQIMK